MNLSNSPFDFVIAFFSGVLVSFTPCVYPLIPITVGYIGARSPESRFKGLLLSFIYVTGIAVTYSALGLLASLTGTIFGKISSHPLTNILVGTIIILFGLSMLDLFNLPLFRIAKPPTLKKQNYFSTFIFGLSSGLLISPCLTPVLGSILAYLTTKKTVLYGSMLLFCFAYGLGFILILLGTFSGFLLSLPKIGRWMLYIKRFFSFVLIGIGIYFIYTALRRL